MKWNSETKFLIGFFIFLASVSLVAYLINTETRVSFFEGLLYIFGNFDNAEQRAHCIDCYYWVVESCLFAFFSVTLLKKWVILAVLMMLFITIFFLAYFPFIYDDHPEIGF